MSFGGIYLAGLEPGNHNDIHNKMATQMHWEFNQTISYIASAELGRNR